MIGKSLDGPHVDVPVMLLDSEGRLALTRVTDEEGSLSSVVVGTDSGFEGVTRIYYTRVVVTLDPITSTSNLG